MASFPDIKISEPPLPTIEWRANPPQYALCQDIVINGKVIGLIAPLPRWSDRGRWQVIVTHPCIDATDNFPRYYMERETAKRETELFLRLRLWRRD